jgi:hypothetical protein
MKQGRIEYGLSFGRLGARERVLSAGWKRRRRSTGEGKLQMQTVETQHDRKVGLRRWPRQVVDAAAAYTQNLGLLADRQVVSAVDHCFALSNPALVSPLSAL